jgi:uncharacterized protein YkwD
VARNFTLLLALAAGCVPPLFVPGEPGSVERPRSAEGAPPRPAASAVLSDARFRSEILEEVNVARRSSGAPLLLEDAALAAAASDFALELARRRRLSHQSDRPGRRTMAERLDSAGAANWIAAGENLAAVHSAEPRLVETIVQGWLDSPGHRRNLLEPTYSRAGTGVARGADGYWYIAQVYVRSTTRTGR